MIKKLKLVRGDGTSVNLDIRANPDYKDISNSLTAIDMNNRVTVFDPPANAMTLDTYSDAGATSAGTTFMYDGLWYQTENEIPAGNPDPTGITGVIQVDSNDILGVSLSTETYFTSIVYA